MTKKSIKKQGSVNAKVRALFDAFINAMSLAASDEERAALIEQIKCDVEQHMPKENQARTMLRLYWQGARWSHFPKVVIADAKMLREILAPIDSEVSQEAGVDVNAFDAVEKRLRAKVKSGDLDTDDVEILHAWADEVDIGQVGGSSVFQGLMYLAKAYLLDTQVGDNGYQVRRIAQFLQTGQPRWIDLNALDLNSPLIYAFLVALEQDPGIELSKKQARTIEAMVANQPSGEGLTSIESRLFKQLSKQLAARADVKHKPQKRLQAAQIKHSLEVDVKSGSSS